MQMKHQHDNVERMARTVAVFERIRSPAMAVANFNKTRQPCIIGDALRPTTQYFHSIQLLIYNIQ